MAHYYDPEESLFGTSHHSLRYVGPKARVRQIEKIERTLLHVCAWHYVNVYVLMALLNIQKSAAEETLSMLLRENLLQLIPNNAVPGRVAMMTAFGLNSTFRFASPEKVNPKVPIHPSRIRVDTMSHNLIAAWFVCELRRLTIAEGASEDWIVVTAASKIQRNRFQAGDRIPDAEFGLIGEAPTEIEVQETYDTTFPRRMSRLAERINSGKTKNAFVVSTNEKLLKFYEKDLHKESRFWWYSAARKRWDKLPSRESPYCGNAVGKIEFEHIPDRGRFYRF